MTIIRFEREEHCQRFKASGHAGYHPGNDIVCAACSIVAQALAESLKREKACSVAWKRDDAKGEMCLRVIYPSGGQCQQRVNAMMDMAKVAYAMLAEAYPEHVKIAE